MLVRLLVLLSRGRKLRHKVGSPFHHTCTLTYNAHIFSVFKKLKRGIKKKIQLNVNKQNADSLPAAPMFQGLCNASPICTFRHL